MTNRLARTGYIVTSGVLVGIVLLFLILTAIDLASEPPRITQALTGSRATLTPTKNTLNPGDSLRATSVLSDHGAQTDLNGRSDQATIAPIVLQQGNGSLFGPYEDYFYYVSDPEPIINAELAIEKSLAKLPADISPSETVARLITGEKFSARFGIYSGLKRGPVWVVAILAPDLVAGQVMGDPLDDPILYPGSNDPVPGALYGWDANSGRNFLTSANVDEAQFAEISQLVSQNLLIELATPLPPE